MSLYACTLPPEAKQRYIKKLDELGFNDDDPFTAFESSKIKRTLVASSWVDDATLWPDIEFGDIYTYLIDTPGPFTRESMHAYRSLDAFVYYFDGWVQTCEYKKGDKGFCIIRAKVHRSQALTQEPHRAWVALRESDHSVECGHCTCMAGLGEVCSHIGGILFKIEASVRFRQQTSCTSLPCQWNQTYVKKIDAVQLDSIKFTKPKHKANSTLIANGVDIESPLPLVSDPSALLDDLKSCAPNAVVFTVVNPQASNVRSEKLPINLKHMFDPSASNMTSGELAALCMQKFHEIKSTSEQNAELEKLTRKQSKSGLWRQYRLGRITTSNFKEAANTNIKTPSKSLIKKIVHGTTFSSAATNWGKRNEDLALASYYEIVSKHHINMRILKCGFFISDEFPFLGSTPDSIVECDCCGKGTVEVKCPYNFKNDHPCHVIDERFCLKKHDIATNICDNGLKYNHSYFYQVQGQMGICNVSYCDFVCHTTKGAHIERIMYDHTFFISVVKKLSVLFKECILAELLTHNLLNGCETENCQTVSKRMKKT